MRGMTSGLMMTVVISSMMLLVMTEMFSASMSATVDQEVIESMQSMFDLIPIIVLILVTTTAVSLLIGRGHQPRQSVLEKHKERYADDEITLEEFEVIAYEEIKIE